MRRSPQVLEELETLKAARAVHAWGGRGRWEGERGWVGVAGAASCEAGAERGRVESEEVAWGDSGDLCAPPAAAAAHTPSPAAAAVHTPPPAAAAVHTHKRCRFTGVLHTRYPLPCLSCIL